MTYRERRRRLIVVQALCVLMALPPGVFSSPVQAASRTASLARESVMETFRNPQITGWNRHYGVESPGTLASGGGQSLSNPASRGATGGDGMTPQSLWITNEGRLEWADQDLVFPGVGMHLSFERIWRGSVTAYDGPLGQSWEFSWNKRLHEDSGSGDVTFHDLGRLDVYTEASGSYTSPLGRYDALVKDTGPNPDVFTRTDKYGTTETYEDEGSGWYRLVSIADSNGNTLELAYDGSSRLTTVTDTLARDTTLGYDGNGRITSITDPASRVWDYLYDGSGRLTRVNNPADHGVLYGYDGSSRLTSVQQPEDSSPSLVMHYDSTSPIARVTRQTKNGSDFDLLYDTTNRWVTIQDREKATRETRYHYDTSGRVISRQIWEDTVSGSPRTTAWTYNSANEVTLVTFHRGNRVEYSYDSLGNIENLELQQTSADTTSPVTWTYTYTALARVSTLTDPNGRTWDYDYDGSGNLTQLTAPSVTVPAGIASSDLNGNSNNDGTIVQSWTYNGQGLVSSHTDAVGTVTNYDYSTVNSLDAYLDEIVRDVGGLAITTSYAYDAAGNVTSQTDGNGQTTTHTVNTLNQVTQSIEPLGVTRAYTYDDNGRLIQSSASNDTDVGNSLFVVNHEYDGNNHLTRTIEDVTGAARLTTAFAYDANERMTKRTSAEGHETIYAFEASGRNAAVTRKAASAPDDAISARSYDGNGNLLASVDPRGNTTSYEYDLRDRLTRVTDAYGHFTFYAYDLAGNMTRERRFTSGSTQLTATDTFFDEANRAYKTETWAKKADLTTNLGGGTQTKTTWRDEAGRLIQSTGDICGCAETRYVYDAIGRQVTVIDALSGDPNKTISEYDDNGQVTKSTRKDRSQDTGIETHKDVATEMVYDARGRLVTRKDRLDVSNTADTIYQYGLRDQLTRTVNGVGDETLVEYNEQLWRTKVTQVTAGTNVVTEYEHDDEGHVVVHRAKNAVTGDQETEYTYDNLDRLVTTEWPDGGLLVHTYDKAGNRVSTTDPMGTVVVCSYDDRNLLTAKAIDLATDVIGPTSVTFGYDALGRRILAATDENGAFGTEITWTWNTLGKMETETQVLDGWNSGAGRTITYVWNVKGQQTGVTYPVSGDVVTYVRDDLDRVAEISRNSDPVVAYTFSGSRVIGKEFPGSHAEMTYDGAGRLTSIHHKDTSSGNTLARFDYGFDRAHRITHQDKVYYDDVQNTRILGDVRDEGEQYAYDGAGRLVTVLRGVPTAEIATAMATNISNTDYEDLVEYAYDPVGNRLTLEVDGTPTVTYAHNIANEMTTENAASHTYDDNGNLEGMSNARKYDYKNRLASFDNGVDTFIWHYDALGRLVQRDRAGAERHQRNYYDGQHIVDKITHDSGEDTEDLSNSYVFGERIDELLLYANVTPSPDELHYAHSDHLGSIQVLADETGAITESYRYDAWGVPTVVDDTFTKLAQGSTSEVGNVYWYTGRSYAAQASPSGEDWYHYRARHYRADVGRFGQRHWGSPTYLPNEQSRCGMFAANGCSASVADKPKPATGIAVGCQTFVATSGILDQKTGGVCLPYEEPCFFNYAVEIHVDIATCPTSLGGKGEAILTYGKKYPKGSLKLPEAHITYETSGAEYKPSPATAPGGAQIPNPHFPTAPGSKPTVFIPDSQLCDPPGCNWASNSIVQFHFNQELGCGKAVILDVVWNFNNLGTVGHSVEFKCSDCP